jgi:hypothetical protein
VGLILGESSKQAKKTLRKEKEPISHPQSKMLTSAPSKIIL